MPKINQEEYEVLKGLGNTWKWIARDKCGVLGVYDAKVVKTKFHNFWVMAIKKKINSTLFSFIQWEDEEPHNISELIEEYEFENVLSDEERFYELYNVNESEEAEVKKDKEWAKKEVYKYFSYKGVIEARNALVFTKGVIDQLDEPEVLSQKWIDKNKTSIDRKLDGTPIYKVREELLQNLLVPTLSKKKKVQLSQKTADELNRYKELGYSLKDLLVIASSKQAQEKLARAWLDGYTVEEEQKYQVIIRDGEYVRLYLCKNNGNVMIGTNDNYIEKCPEVTYLTEQEIKEYDERFWVFAVNIEELEE